MRALTILGVLAVLLGAAATPALADSARPTNYQSEVVEIEPPAPAVDARIVGGDAFLDLRVEPGTEVTVLGYQGEPYLRFDDSGVVWANTRSPAHYLNNDRYSQVSLPDNASPEAAPTWVQVGGDGQFGWHDHRTHWMAPQPPPGIDTTVASEIQEWTVPIMVDGVEAEINGRLFWLPSVSPIPWVLIATIAFVVVVLIRRSTKRIAWAVIVGTGAALLVGAAQATVSPLAWGGEVLTWAPPAVALFLGLAALRGKSTTLVGAASVLIGVWCLLRIATLWMPVLPTELPTGIERAAFAVAMGSAAGVGFAVLLQFLRPAPDASYR